MAPTANLILQLHGTVYGYLPAEGGHWKLTDNEIVERAAGGEILRVRFRPVPAVATPQSVDDLCQAIHDREDTGDPDPLVTIPLAILDFLCIHPFRDGNGRVGRLLTLLLLYRAGYEVGRFVSVERVIEESKQTYYETLEASSHGWHDGNHDPFPWLRYFWGVLTKAYREFEQRLETVSTGRGSKSERIRETVTRQTKPFSITEIERLCPDVSRETIRNVLRQLRDAGRVRSLGRGRGAKWTTTDAS